MSYSPKDIEAFNQRKEYLQVHQYCRTLGKAEYEWVAADLIKAAQQAEKWIPLPKEAFAHHFKERVPGTPEQNSRGAVLGMLEEGMLREEGIGVVLSDKAIEVIATRYPARAI